LPRPKGGRENRTESDGSRQSGQQRHIVVERHGIPLTVRLTAANRPDGSVFTELIDGIKPIKRPRGRPRKRPDKLHADKAYDSAPCRVALRRRGIKCRIARKGIERNDRLGRHCWVVERSLAWLAKYRRLTIRYERRADIHQGFLSLGCALICCNFLGF
jgi:transposase